MLSRCCWSIFLPFIFLPALHPASQLLAGPRVDIVIGDKAPALERLAADELSSQLKRIYEAEVKIGSTAPANAPHVIFVGSPDTNASMKPFANSWPSGDKKLTDHGHLLRSVTHNKKPALLIGGGSPVATFWAVAEFGHRLGIRSMLFGDLDPVSPPEFSLAAVDVLVEPSPRHRGWQFNNSSYVNSGSWSTEEFRRVLRQLAKLRFNRVTINLSGSQPYIHLDYAGVSRSTSELFRTPSIVVSGDTLGRKAFSGAKLFEHPNFVGADSYAKRRECAETHLRAVIAAAQELGMNVDLSVYIGAIGDFPAVFAKVAGESTPRDGSTFSPKLSQLPNKPKLAEFVKAWIEAIVKNYPTIDGLQLNSDDLEERGVEWLVEKTGPWKRADGREIPLTRRQYSRGKWMVMPFNEAQSSIPDVMDFPLGESFGVLPSFRPQFWEADWVKIVRRGCGFEVAEPGFGENDLGVYWLSRNSCQQPLSPMQACRELLAPVCGEEVDHRVWKAIELVELIAEDDPTVGSGIGLTNIESNLKETVAPPKAWNVARDNYLNAMNEMYRANTRAREGGRAYTLYLARRFEFAYEYMNCVEAVRKSAIAERDNDRSVQIAEIEKAIEALNNALNAMAAVARSNSDRGLIAVLNENGYRPLKKKLAEAEAAAK